VNRQQGRLQDKRITHLCVLLIIDFGLDVQPYNSLGWLLAGHRSSTALTEDKGMVNPQFSPNEDVDSDQEREKHWDEHHGINEQESTPAWDVESGRCLKT